jgi:hypothetical protein
MGKPPFDLLYSERMGVWAFELWLEGLGFGVFGLQGVR